MFNSEDHSLTKRQSKFSVLDSIVVGYLYLVGIVLFFNLFSSLMAPEVFEPCFISLN